MVREYAFSRQERFDAVLWIEAETTKQLSQGFARIASKLVYRASNNSVITRKLALKWLNNNSLAQTDPETISSEGNKATWLLVFNTVDNLELL